LAGDKQQRSQEEAHFVTLFGEVRARKRLKRLLEKRTRSHTLGWLLQLADDESGGKKCIHRRSAAKVASSILLPTVWRRLLGICHRRGGPQNKQFFSSNRQLTLTGAICCKMEAVLG
jgi:hypothetical protein